MDEKFSRFLAIFSKFTLYDPYGVTKKRTALRNFDRMAKLIEAQNSIPLKAHVNAVGRHMNKAISYLI